MKLVIGFLIVLVNVIHGARNHCSFDGADVAAWTQWMPGF